MTDVALKFEAEEEELFLQHFQDKQDADITIECLDGGQFHVYKIILAKASPVFQDMLLISGSQNIPGNDNSRALPVVGVTEDSMTVECLLQFCYPQDDPVIETLSHLHRVLVACDKYQMDAIGKRASRLLDAFASNDPLVVFCISCHTKAIEAARNAAFECLKRPFSYIIDIDIPEIDLITASTLQRLQRYYRACVKAAEDVATLKYPYELDWITNNNSCWFQCRKCTARLPTGQMRIKNRSMIVHPRQWWGDFMATVAERLEDQPGAFSVTRYRVTVRPPDCIKCGPAFAKDMLEFVPEMEGAIQSAMRKVSLELNL